MNEELKKVLIVAGPTAIGKTAFAIRLCEELDGEVISADSMQVYQGFDIASAKPTQAERARVRHHLVDCIPREASFSVVAYQALALEAIRDVLSRGKQPVICGGTGLYIEALTEQFRFDFNLNPEQNSRNLNLSSKKINPEQTFPEYDYQMYVLYPKERAQLYHAIEMRIEQMFAAGLLEEARQPAGHTSGQAIGWKELQPYLAGEITLDEAKARLKQATRNYAKRQMTWFRRMERLWSERDPASVIHCDLELSSDQNL